MAKYTFQFSNVPTSLDELKSLKEASLDTPFKTCSLAMLTLLVYVKNKALGEEMIRFLMGPALFTPSESAFLKDRFRGKEYKARSFFQGATPKNDYQPTMPLTITIEDNPYSYPEENRATLLVKSSGADSLRQVTFRKKPSTGQWFLVDYQCLADIRIPESEDVWA